MAAEKQKEAAKKNIKKAQAAWEAISPTEHARSQPEGRVAIHNPFRTRPGASSFALSSCGNHTRKKQDR